MSVGVPSEQGEGEPDVVPAGGSPPITAPSSQLIDEQVNAFFYSHFVIHTNPASPFPADLESTVPGIGRRALLASMRAVGLAGLSRATKASELAPEANRRYLAAIQLINQALGRHRRSRRIRPCWPSWSSVSSKRFLRVLRTRWKPSQAMFMVQQRSSAHDGRGNSMLREGYDCSFE